MTFQLRDIPWKIRDGQRPFWMQSPEQQALLLSAAVTRPWSGIRFQGSNLNGLKFLICAGEQRSHLGRIAYLLFI